MVLFESNSLIALSLVHTFPLQNTSQKCPMCSTPQKISDISMISYEKPVYNSENEDQNNILKNKLELIGNQQ